MHRQRRYRATLLVHADENLECDEKEPKIVWSVTTRKLNSSDGD